VWVQGSHEQKANAVRLPTLLNISACQLQMADYEGAIDSASQVSSAFIINIAFDSHSQPARL
jgi:hypothetical protein